MNCLLLKLQLYLDSEPRFHEEEVIIKDLLSCHGRRACHCCFNGEKSIFHFSNLMSCSQGSLSSSSGRDRRRKNICWNWVYNWFFLWIPFVQYNFHYLDVTFNLIYQSKRTSTTSSLANVTWEGDKLKTHLLPYTKSCEIKHRRNPHFISCTGRWTGEVFGQKINKNNRKNTNWHRLSLLTTLITTYATL